MVLLEDLKSSNQEFSLADATVASMSFPGATEPVRLHIYKEKGIESDRKSLGTIDIIDGGIADNTGLATLFDVFFDEVKITKVQDQRLTVLLIDADNSTASNFGTLLANRHEENPTPLFSLDWPFKGGSKGLDSTFVLHDISQRRELALLFRQTADRLTQLNKDGRNISIQLIPVALSAAGQCGEHAQHPCVPTKYEITSTEEQILLESASQVIEQDYSASLQLFLTKYGLEELDGLDHLFSSPETYKSIPLYEVISRETMTDREEYNRRVQKETDERNCRKLEEEMRIEQDFYDTLEELSTPQNHLTH